MKQEIVEEVIKNYGTPSYVFDLDSLQERVRKITSILKNKGISLCYAMKANPFLISVLKEDVERLEVCSPGEFRICEREQIPMERLVISGVNKEAGDIQRIVETYDGSGIFTIESRRQLEILGDAAERYQKQLSVLIRITSGNQFGVNQEEAISMLSERGKYPKLQFRGIQYYSGTQKKKLSIIEKELRELDEFCQGVREKLGFELEEIEYGPGLFVSYFPKEATEGEEMLQEFCELVSQMNFQGKITLEMGRYIVADCGNYLTTLLERKENAGQIFGIVDGGIHHLNYYGQTMAMKIPYLKHFLRGERSSEHEVEEKWNICGSLCTVADVIVKQLPLQGATPGDVLVFERTGAYSPMEGISLFLSRDLPKVLFYSQEYGIQLVRDTIQTDYFNCKIKNKNRKEEK